jgi:hypothetical protein
MDLSILNSRFLPRIVIFIGSSTAHSANLTFGNLQVHSQGKRDIRICFEGYSRFERINGRLFLKKPKL